MSLFNFLLVDPRRGRTDNGHTNGRSRTDTEEDSESQRSDNTNYERDVVILNHCFDDIERFIARLQYASASYKELERRRRTRKSKRIEPGGKKSNKKNNVYTHSRVN